MYQGELEVEDRESLEDFFDNTSLVSDEEQEKTRKVIDEADTIEWPIEIVFEIQDDTWAEYAEEHPDEASVIEPMLKNEGDEEGDEGDAEAEA